MIRRRRNVIWLTLFLLLAGLLAACGRSTVEIGMMETTLPGSWEASYRTFSGAKRNTFGADAGETLVLDYKVVVDKGMLSLRVENPDGEDLWDLSLEEEAADTVEVPLNTDGRYTIVVEGDATGGGFDLSWELK